MVWELTKSLIPILGILLFYIGWIYLNYFLASFGLTLNYIKIEFTTFYFYGFFVLLNIWGFILFIVFIGLYVFAYYKRDRLTRFFFAIILLITIALFITMFFMAKSAGNHKAEKILFKQDAICPIRFCFKNSYSEMDSLEDETNFILYHRKVMHLNSTGKLYYLFENSDEIVVFHNPNVSAYIKQGLDQSIEIYKIRKETFHYYYLSVDASRYKK